MKVQITKLPNGLELRSTDFAIVSHICFLDSHAIVDQNTMGTPDNLYKIEINGREILFGKGEYQVKESWSYEYGLYAGQHKRIIYIIVLEKI